MGEVGSLTYPLLPGAKHRGIPTKHKGRTPHKALLYPVPVLSSLVQCGPCSRVNPAGRGTREHLRHLQLGGEGCDPGGQEDPSTALLGKHHSA